LVIGDDGRQDERARVVTEIGGKMQAHAVAGRVSEAR